MIARRAIVGLSLLCALAFCAFAAPSAIAAKGTTAFTCAPVTPGTGQFDDAHCTVPNAQNKGSFSHEEIKPGTETKVTISNKNTANNTTEHTTFVFHAVNFGVKITKTCTKVHGEGTLTNNAGPPMNVTGKGTVTFSECVLSGELAEKDPACKLKEGTIVGKAKITTPTEAMELKFEEEGGAFASFTIEGCTKIPSANKKYEVTGSFTGIVSGATAEFTEASTKEIKVGGQQASGTGKATLTMSTTEPGIALTTTAT